MAKQKTIQRGNNKPCTPKCPPPVIEVVGVNCEGEPVVVQDATLTVPNPDTVQKVQICNPSIDPEVVFLSNDGGETVFPGWEVFDTSTNPPTSTLYINGVDVTATHEVVPVPRDTDFDYEESPVCVEGETWTKINVYDPTGSVPTFVETLWLDTANAPVAAPADFTLGACAVTRTWLGNEVINFDAGDDAVLTAVPTGANVAEMQFQGSQIIYTFGTSISDGIFINDFGRLELESTDEIANFIFQGLANGKAVIHYFYNPNQTNN